MLALGQHQGLVEQLDLDDGGLDATCLSVHLHGNGAFGNDASLAALTDAGAVHARLQHWQLVGGQSDHLHEAVIDAGLCLAKGIVPRMCAAAIAASTRPIHKYRMMFTAPGRPRLPWYVQKEYGMTAGITQLAREILSIAFERNPL